MKLPMTNTKSGEDELRAIVQDACKIEKDLQSKSGMVVIQDPSDPLHWESTYFALTTENDVATTPPPIIPTKPTSGLCRDKPGSIIHLTAVSDNESPPTQRAGTAAGVTVKQEFNDDNGVAKVTNKGKKPVKDGATSAGNTNVATKSYHHGGGNAVAKTTKAETILANIADGLSPQAQEKREVSRINLIRETMGQERKDWAIDERVQELKLEIHALKKEINDLCREATFHRDRATEAVSRTQELLTKIRTICVEIRDIKGTSQKQYIKTPFKGQGKDSP